MTVMNNIRIKILLLAIALMPSILAQKKFQTKNRAETLQIYRAKRSKSLKKQNGNLKKNNSIS